MSGGRDRGQQQAGSYRPSRVHATRRPPRLHALGMTKRFGSLLAIDDVSLTLEPGAFRALLGENGAGKSTLVKCIMGYHHPDNGKIIVNDQSAPYRRRVMRMLLGSAWCTSISRWFPT